MDNQTLYENSILRAEAEDKNEALAIIIPAFKILFLEKAILSILNQSDPNFRLYIFDDESPEDVKAVYERLCGGRTNCIYHRFKKNLGGFDLAAHWNRCVNYTEREAWIWIFSDDDIADTHCVKEFWKYTKFNRNPILRFNTQVINDNDELVANNPRHPEDETVDRFMIARLSGQRQSYVIEYIFKRKLFNENGGFHSLPDAWASDDLTWIKFGTSISIRTIEGPLVKWRYGNSNLAGKSRSRNRQKIKATHEFLEVLRGWVVNRSGTLSRISEKQFDRLAHRWYILTLKGRMPLTKEDFLYAYTHRLPAIGKTPALIFLVNFALVWLSWWLKNYIKIIVFWKVRR